MENLVWCDCVLAPDYVFGVRWVVFFPQEKLTLTDLGVLMTAAVCHDLDHPGYNNT